MKKLAKKLIKSLKRNKESSLITINLSKSALLHNLEIFQKINPRNSIFPVLKSNAYGHGIVEIAEALEGKVPFFVIDSYFEADNLRNEGIKTPLLILGYVRPENINENRLKNISFIISNLETLRQIKSKTKIHLKIDTGMHRQGILPSELDQAIQIIKNNKNIELEGICSHLADADNKNSKQTNAQIDLWNSIVGKFESVKYKHLSNTYGHSYGKEIKANSSRLGIGLYGLAEIDDLDLQPVMQMETIITSIKDIEPHEAIGYGGTYKTSDPTKIATIPVGYYEGIDRRLSNKGFVKIGENFCPIVGRVSMNITTIDITNIPDVKIGDIVVAISSNKNDKNSVENMARSMDTTIPYELVVNIPSQLRRVVF